MGGKSSGNQTTTNRQVLDPSVRRAVDFLTNQSLALGGGGGFGGFNIPGGGRFNIPGGFSIPDSLDPRPSLTPELSPDTLLGLGLFG